MLTILSVRFSGIGVPVLVVNLTQNSSDSRLADAAKNQLQYLLTRAPRTQDGAISHRASEVQLWWGKLPCIFASRC